MGPLKGDRVLSRGSKFALFEILQNKEHFYYAYLVVRLWFTLTLKFHRL